MNKKFNFFNCITQEFQNKLDNVLDKIRVDMNKNLNKEIGIALMDRFDDNAKFVLINMFMNRTTQQLEKDLCLTLKILPEILI